MELLCASGKEQVFHLSDNGDDGDDDDDDNEGRDQFLLAAERSHFLSLSVRLVANNIN